MKGFGGGAGGMQQLMRQANKMQSKMKKVQDELSAREFEGSAGGNAVTVKVNGDNKILSVTVNPQVLDPEDVEMLQDMILAATNDALQLAKSTSKKEMDKVTGGLGNMPGLF